MTLIYLDVSCLNRPFDDQSVARIRLEAEAVLLVKRQIERGRWREVSSVMAQIEIEAIPDPVRRARVFAMLPDDGDILEVSDAVLDRAASFKRFGLNSADAVHLAAAEAAGADVLLTCDDRLCRRVARRALITSVKVLNPVDFLREHARGTDA